VEEDDGIAGTRVDVRQLGIEDLDAAAGVGIGGRNRHARLLCHGIIIRAVEGAAMIRRHIVPNIGAPLMILATVNIGSVILIEAALSFLGFGVPPPRPSWGGMLSGAGLVHMLRAPWLALWPGVALSLTVFGANMLGDALRDLLDPRLRGSG
jgi:peptide/nickel transport system permease protein